jgi:BMFP domain-containing protein YqiC
VSHKNRKQKRLNLQVDPTVYEDKTAEPPATPSATTSENTAVPSESAFPGLPQVKTQVDAVLEPSVPTGYTAGYIEGVMESRFLSFKKQVDHRIEQVNATFAAELATKTLPQQEAQELWNQRIEKAVMASLERSHALEPRVRDLEMEQDASEDQIKQHGERIGGLEQQVIVLEREEVVGKEELASELDKVRKDFDHLSDVTVEEFEEGEKQVARVLDNLALLESRIAALESQAQGTALPGRQRSSYQRGGDFRR